MRRQINLAQVMADWLEREDVSMPKYEVTFSGSYEVEADDEQDAISMAVRDAAEDATAEVIEGDDDDDEEEEE